MGRFEFTQENNNPTQRTVIIDEKEEKSEKIEVAKIHRLEKISDLTPTTEPSGIKIRRCKNIPKTKDELDTFIDRATENQEPYAFIQGVLDIFEICSQHKTADSDYIKLLVNEAENGSVEALKEIWKIPESEYFEVMAMPNPSREEIISHRNEFSKLKYRLAHDLAMSGNAEATIKLIKAYQINDPLTQKPNYAKSLAYADFGLQTTQDNDLYLKINWFKEKILQNSSTEEIALAFDLTDEMLIEVGSGGN
jgi:hypothetical protein